MKRYLWAAVLVLSLSACGGTPDPTPSHSTTPSTETVTVYFVGITPNDFRLFSEEHDVAATGDKALSALTAIIDGEVIPFDSDYSSAWQTSSSSVNSLKRSGSLATLDIDFGSLNVGAAGEAAALNQLLWTAMANDSTIKSLQITVNGSKVESLAGHMSVLQPLLPGIEYEVLADVQIDSLIDRATVNNPVVMSGMACTFEAQVAWELSQDDVVISSGHTQAATGCPVRSTWSVSLGTLNAGFYEFRAFELSAKDGSLVVEDTKEFTVK